MGTVYLAEQEGPLRRRVALKLIKLGMDTKEVIARFEAERQALAMMDHPGVAKVHDAGATEQGRPYFVMEHVQGIPITGFCDKHRLSTQERLGLFVQVCQAIHHAHQKAIIHRDIKPSNVLVAYQEGKPVPKVIDFGVAKATNRSLTERTLFTEQGVLIGTPEYMSPEQAEMTGLNVDTTTDVYSLGVLLYEMLTGTLPFDSRELRHAGLPEIQRKIREDEPPTPSTRISTLGDKATDMARRRRTTLGALRRQLRGDLDWIVMRAMEKDRGRRYASASELAADVSRYLDHQPVVASPPSPGYRARKFFQRHRVGSVVAGSTLFMLIAVVAALSHQNRVIGQERDRANQEAETAQQVSDFLVDLFEVSDPGEARGNTITAREILDTGAERIGTELGDQPIVRAKLMGTMGTVYHELGLYEPSRVLLEEALAIREQMLGSDHPDVATTLNNLAVLLMDTGDYAEAQSLYERALAVREKALGPDHPDVAQTLNNLANLLWTTADYAGARPLHERALAIRERALGPDHPDVAQTLNNLATLLKDTGDFAGARPLYERALAIQEKTLRPEHPDVAQTLNNLALLRMTVGDYPGARPLCERVLAIREKTLDPDHPDVATSLNNLAGLLYYTGDYAAARPLYERALASWEKTFGPDHPRVATGLDNVGNVLTSTGDYAAARELHERALAIREETLGPDHPDVALSLCNLGALLGDTGDYAGARLMFERALVIWEKARGPDHPVVAVTLDNLAGALRGLGEDAEAEKLEARAETIRGKVEAEN